MLSDLWLWFSWIVSLLSVGHVLLYKRDPRAQLGWCAVCLGLPGFGALLYWLLGVNRLRTRARGWLYERDYNLKRTQDLERRYGISAAAGAIPDHFSGLFRLANKVTRRPLLAGNQLQVLHNGEAAFPAMIEAIDNATESIELATYIFENNTTGHQVADALLRAADRGVHVRVLVDGLGEKYSFPPIGKRLQHSRLRYALFLPFTLNGRGLYLNLRNHGKILVVDECIGFTGGMNIGDRHMVQQPPFARKMVDIQFKVEGPVVAHLRQAFAENWYFTTGEQLPEQSQPKPTPKGDALCRGICGGPDEGFEKLHWILTAALDNARHRIQIMTPYFIPDRTLINTINNAALRGVDVEIILPQKSNLPFVDWASHSYFWELLKNGVRIYHRPPPFAHSKLFLADNILAVVGSANLDPRSLRLNFEFNLGVYDRDFSTELSAHFQDVRQQSRQVTLKEMDDRSLPIKLRDALCKLFSPYL